MLTICLFLAAALAWSFYRRLECMRWRPVRSTPPSKAKVIRLLDPGKIIALHVENGQHVRAGDLLLALDPIHDISAEHSGATAVSLLDDVRRMAADQTA
ncbi:hypothetical protein [Bradyrhizobium sp. USDA 4454]